MFNSLFAKGYLTAGNVFLTLGLAILLGFIGALYYTRTNRTSRSFSFTLALLPLITSTVIMVVNGNLGAGIAVAGSFSLIRFRSVQGSGQEILSVFLAAAVGLCLGAGYAAVGCILMLFYLLVQMLLTICRFGGTEEMMRELRISIPESFDYNGMFDDLFSSHLSFCELEKIRTVEMGTAFQLIYRVIPKNPQTVKAFLDSIRERNGNLSVSLGMIPDTRTEM